MSSYKFHLKSLIHHSLASTLNWHLRDHALERGLPPWENIKVLSTEGSPGEPGSQFTLETRSLAFFRSRITLEYCNCKTGESFGVAELKGPFKEWLYQVQGIALDEHASEIIDRFTYAYKFPRVLSSFFSKRLRKRLRKIIRYKCEMLQNDLDILDSHPYEKRLKVLITGATGFIGRHLLNFLEFAGHDVWKLSRTDKGKKSILYSEPDKFEGFDAIIHLAGESIAKGRWTEKKKEAILNSRYKGTKELVQMLASLKKPPKVFICASAVGYYGDRGDEILTEESLPGEHFFLSEVCEHWERASKELEKRGIRVASTRFGLVLRKGEGVLKEMAPAFELGMGGKIGDGLQYLSWIALEDLIGALYHVLMTPSLSGPINCVSPFPVQNAVFSKELAQALHRWQGPPIPAFLVKLFLGEKGVELLLASARAQPKKLLETNFSFHFPHLRQALRHTLP